MKRVLYASLVVLLLGVAARAQGGSSAQSGPTMTLAGAVYDVNGAVVAGSKILLSAAGARYEAATSGEGVYSIKLPLGVYRIEVSAPGFCPSRVERYRVVNSTYGKMSLDFVLEVPDLREKCGPAGGDKKGKSKKGGKPEVEIIME